LTYLEPDVFRIYLLSRHSTAEYSDFQWLSAQFLSSAIAFLMLLTLIATVAPWKQACIPVANLLLETVQMVGQMVGQFT
jgi:hypothetical protein